MQAVIMAGGFGTRLRPITCSIPKPMALVANRPMLSHIIELLKKHSGWIEWENLGVRLNCCDTVYIRENPNSKANVVGFYYMASWLYVYPIMKAKNGWLYMYDKDRNIKGWVAPNAQCINSYTTCN